MNSTINLEKYWAILCNDEYTLSYNGIRSLNNFRRHLSDLKIQGNMEIAFAKIPQNERIEERFEYFCGICWNNIKGDAAYNDKKEVPNGTK